MFSIWLYKKKKSSKYSNSTQNIPELIVFVCLAYYYESKIFEIAHYSLVISGDNNNIIEKTSGGYNWNCSAYGAEWMQSNTNNIYKWTVKNIFGDRNVQFGIVSNYPHLAINKCYNSEHSYSYFFHQSLRQNGKPIPSSIRAKANAKFGCASSETIIFILNFKDSTITINKNNESDVIFKQIKKGDDILYKLAITVYTKSNCIEVIDVSNVKQ